MWAPPNMRGTQTSWVRRVRPHQPARPGQVALILRKPATSTRGAPTRSTCSTRLTCEACMTHFRRVCSTSTVRLRRHTIDTFECRKRTRSLGALSVISHGMISMVQAWRCQAGGRVRKTSSRCSVLRLGERERGVCASVSGFGLTV